MKPVDEEEINFTIEDLKFLSDTIDKKWLINNYNVRYSRMLTYWIKIFMRQKRSIKVNKHVNTIIKYLFVRRWTNKEGIEEFKYISNSELRRGLVGDNKVGRPKNDHSYPIPNRETLEKLLKELAEDGLLERTYSIEKTKRSNTDKAKRTPYFRISGNRLSIDSPGNQYFKEEVYARIDQSLTKDELIRRYKELADKYINVSNNFDRRMKDVGEETVSIFIALSIMRKRGIKEPYINLIKEIKEAKAWEEYLDRNQLVDIYTEDEWGNVTIISEPSVRDYPGKIISKEEMAKRIILHASNIDEWTNKY